ncbi:ABC transporter permease [Pseudonocardia sp. EV170527-09]|uniref:ABC transporter permease n=1 Tax=Pseudonocardia sp. EV170527-09 TaxID=2603411 RepID=UPI0011F1507D|nr:ABC transporter permease [Pseudonocardia sp. EV170527-09]KAA1010980.1 ABC transporter permease [Pseudonocardia sp. EV170527-09]
MFQDTIVVFRRQMRMSLRSPAMILSGLLQPMLYLVLFAPLLQSVAAHVGSANQYTLFVPGLLVQLAVFGAAFTGYGAIGEWRDGVIEGERVTPAHRSALLLGRLGRDLVQLLFQVVVLIALAYAFGMDAPLPELLVGVGITLILGVACAATSNAIALSAKDERVMGSVVNTLLMPIILLSGILLPVGMGPHWLQFTAELMPIKHVVDAVRSCFAGDVTASGVMWGGGWAVLLCLLGVWFGTRTFRAET